MAAFGRSAGKSDACHRFPFLRARSTSTGMRHAGTNSALFQLWTVVSGMPVSSAIAFDPPRSLMISGTVVIARQYDNRIGDASDNTFFGLDGWRSSYHHAPVESSREFLDRLKAVATQEAIAKALGIAQPNAATLFTPGKNGKLRALKWDEGVRLAKAFGIAPQQEDPKPAPVPAPDSDLNEDTLAALIQDSLQELPAATIGDLPRQLAGALHARLELLRSGSEPVDLGRVRALRERASPARVPTTRDERAG